jgi:hypothetical protein
VTGENPVARVSGYLRRLEHPGRWVELASLIDFLGTVAESFFGIVGVQILAATD